MRIRAWILGIISAGLLAACGNVPQNATTSTTTTASGITTTTPTTTPAQISLVASQYQVKSDNSDSATLTAIVTDASNAAVSNATVTFAATAGGGNAGFLSAPSAVTDTYGQATVSFSAGLIDKSNKTVTVTATVAGTNLSAQIPIVVTGSTVTLTPGNTSLPSDGSVGDALTVTVTDAGGNPIYNTPVSISVAGTGNATATPRATATDTAGQVVVDVYGTAAGTATLTVSAAGATATQTYTVAAPANAFGVTAPATDPYTMSTNTPLTVTVNAPASTQVVFSTSVGAWQTTGTTTETVTVAGGTASATLTSANAGVATVQVQDANDPTLTDTMTVIFAQPASAAANIAAQANVNVVAPSVGGQSHTATITATVTDVNNQPVAGAPVVFSIPHPSGGGESVSPVYVLTDAFGQAQTTFTSGSIATGGQGVDVYATLAKTNTPADPYSIVNIVVGGQALSVAISEGSQIFELDPATYRLPMAVLVTDGNGNAVSGAQVTLKTWPLRYGIGSPCGPVIADFPNEDQNRNGILDTGEDVGFTVDLYTSTETGGYVLPTDPYAVFSSSITANPDGQLTPPAPAAGSVPATVITDQNGIATFDLVYLKSSAIWIETEITASTQVLGTEATTVTSFWLAPSVPDVGPPCTLPASPYNPPGM